MINSRPSISIYLLWSSVCCCRSFVLNCTFIFVKYNYYLFICICFAWIFCYQWMLHFPSLLLPHPHDYEGQVAFSHPPTQPTWSQKDRFNFPSCYHPPPFPNFSAAFSYCLFFFDNFGPLFLVQQYSGGRWMVGSVPEIITSAFCLDL